MPPSPHDGLLRKARDWFHGLPRRKRWSLVAGVLFLALVLIASIGSTDSKTTRGGSGQSAQAAHRNQAGSADKGYVVVDVSNDGATVHSATFLLRGTVTRGGLVEVDRHPAHVHGGTWTRRVRLRRGNNTFLVEASKTGYGDASTNASVTRALTARERAAIAQVKREREALAAAERAKRAEARRQRRAQREAKRQAASQQQSSACDPNYQEACLDPNAGDYDCAGGTGDGPKYVQGPVQVVGVDHYDLDRDGDGIGCDT